MPLSMLTPSLLPHPQFSPSRPSRKTQPGPALSLKPTECLHHQQACAPSSPPSCCSVCLSLLSPLPRSSMDPKSVPSSIPELLLSQSRPSHSTVCSLLYSLQCHTFIHHRMNYPFLRYLTADPTGPAFAWLAGSLEPGSVLAPLEASAVGAAGSPLLSPILSKEWSQPALV